jgi:hypothetical protein
MKEPPYRKTFQKRSGSNSNVGSDWPQFRLMSYPTAVASIAKKKARPISKPIRITNSVPLMDVR